MKGHRKVTLVPAARRTLLTAVLAAMLGFVPAASAVTYQGSMSTPSVSTDGSSVSSQITMSSLCTATEYYCGFFPVVTTIEGDQPCADTITGSSWVGPLADQSLTATATWSEWPTLYSGPKRACLYAHSASVLVAQSTYTVPAPPAPPSYTPPPPVYTPPTAPVAAPVPQYLGSSEARGLTRWWMKKRYGRRWSRGHSKTVGCPVRSAPEQVGCYAVWLYRHRVYDRTIVITEEETRYTFAKDFSSAPPTSVDPTGSGDFCATHDCIPNFPNGTGSIVQCADGTYSQSGGKPGACSHHGGVARAHAAANPSRLVRTRRPRLVLAEKLARHDLAQRHHAAATLLARAGRG
jgi:hypothetical protein